jgi:hypothetical protein
METPSGSDLFMAELISHSRCGQKNILLNFISRQIFLHAGLRWEHFSIFIFTEQMKWKYIYKKLINLKPILQFLVNSFKMKKAP